MRTPVHPGRTFAVAVVAMLVGAFAAIAVLVTMTNVGRSGLEQHVENDFYESLRGNVPVLRTASAEWCPRVRGVRPAFELALHRMEAATLRDEARETWHRLGLNDRLRTIVVGPDQSIVETIIKSAAEKNKRSAAQLVQMLLNSCEL